MGRHPLAPRGEALRGTALLEVDAVIIAMGGRSEWALPSAPPTVSVRVVWSTRGDGSGIYEAVVTDALRPSLDPLGRGRMRSR